MRCINFFHKTVDLWLWSSNWGLKCVMSGDIHMIYYHANLIIESVKCLRLVQMKWEHISTCLTVHIAKGCKVHKQIMFIIKQNQKSCPTETPMSEQIRIYPTVCFTLGCLSVCLFVCLFTRYLKSLLTAFMNLCGRDCHVERKKWWSFGEDPDHYPDSGCFWRILFHWEISIENSLAEEMCSTECPQV